ncbi:MAG TPA: DUF6644 family protein [Candidatus Acidoferrales bacterium]|nr:DUF6644 family protein [Candidatus Acidoferrales bacterium]
MDSFLQWLASTGFSTTMRESTWAEPIVETVHVLTLTMFLGFAILLDLRLLGVCLTRKRASEVLALFNPWLFGGFAVMVLTGTLLFCGDPVSFYNTRPPFFKAKMIMLVLAGLNVLIFNLGIGRKVAEWDVFSKTPLAAKAAGTISIVLWILIVAAGRAIAYALPPP